MGLKLASWLSAKIKAAGQRMKRSRNSLTVVPAAANQDGDRPREPPPPATPLNFPVLHPLSDLTAPPYSAQQTQQLFASFQKIGPSIEHIRALNLNVNGDLPLDQFIPNGFLPPASWVTDPATSGGSNIFPAPLPSTKTLRNGASVPDHDVFYTRAKELLLDNEDVFRFLQRQPSLPGRPTNLRVAHYRKMWENLLFMAEYWDTSLDNDTTNPNLPENVSMDIDEIRSEAEAAAAAAANQDPSKAHSQNTDTPPNYTGRRIGTGRDMPPKFREDTVFAFAETVAWAFRCRAEYPRLEPKLRMHNMLIPLPQTASIYCTPSDPRLARRGACEGPLMGIQCRKGTVFQKAGEAPGEGQGETMDLLQEIGLGLMIAQKRAREGKVEEEEWKGKWWVETPRWGGGPGEETGTPLVTEDGETAIEKVESATATTGRKRSRRPNSRDKYSALAPPPSTWEKGVTYLQVGKVPGSSYDDIFLLSSLNHHISILRLRVQSKYVDFLNQNNLTISNTSNTKNGKNSPIYPRNEPWSLLEVQRSRWFDLFVADDRVEAMRGIWGVLAWLMRDLK